MILALDSATRQLGLAALAGDTILAEHRWPAARRQTEQLAPAIARLFASLDATPQDVTAVAVAIGPGSFSGLRTALAWAKGFALAQECALVGVPTLDILARAQPEFGGQLACLIQAGRGRVAADTYQYRAGSWQPDNQGHIMSWQALADALAEAASPTLVCGELDDAGRAVLQPLRGRVRIATPGQNVRRAAILAQIAQARIQAGDTDNPLTLAPSYWQQLNVTPPGA